ncbi:phosphate ABC transporter permease subunit PstC [Luteimicrobium subarcticum]|uniref:Phosphate transport system permease protein n=1 Tax=Luteimicrobium subarcticum TaxID=620910 RepID=A0A2M8WT19_9MICO|nr:phosphate ABC transporter permease subunit PstC [Luteimicrobium subarcticum]PJI94038.1 phosphate ABC transporter membrane protein 1 (PhoT family) [Luteimicrobium subarcticum]
MTDLDDLPRRTSTRRAPADRAFRGVLRTGGITVLAIMSFVGIFLLARAWQALRVAGPGFLTTQTWEPDSGNFGIAAVLVGTLLIATVAVSVALPLALGTSLYISEYAPTRLRRTLVSLVDLMAAVPSVVFGLWGFFWLQGNLTGIARWVSTVFAWFPPLSVEGADPDDPLSPVTLYTSSTFVAGLVVALMITPIMTSIMREVFMQAPVGEREGALALGSTRWGMIRSVVLPYGMGGIIGGTMLGLGRALGETIAVYMIISPVFAVQWHVLQNGANSVSSLIALRYGEASPFGMSALMAAGLALFLLTLAVNFGASSIVARSRSGASS